MPGGLEISDFDKSGVFFNLLGINYQKNKFVFFLEFFFYVKKAHENDPFCTFLENLKFCHFFGSFSD